MYTYIEFGSKNHHGGVKNRSEGKVVSIVGTDSPYCHVSLLDRYLEKIPQDEVNSDSKFYLVHYHSHLLDCRCWYFADPYPQKKVKSMLKFMCEGNFTSHSLRATGATCLFDTGILEAVIQKRTGHRSLETLHTYECVTPAQEKVVASMLNPVVPVTSYELPVTSTLSSKTLDKTFLENLPREVFRDLF